jgi:hypothetical protein
MACIDVLCLSLPRAAAYFRDRAKIDTAATRRQGTVHRSYSLTIAEGYVSVQEKLLPQPRFPHW